MINMEGRYHLVFGGTGHYGSMVVKSLINKGVPVRVFTRNASKAKEKLGNQPDYFEGDVLNAQDIVRSLLNVRSIAVCLSAMSSKLIRQMQAIERDAVLTIMDEAQQANITRLVYMSGYEMRAELLDKLKIPEFGAIKIEIEQKISQSDFNWTILGDAPAFDIFFAFVNGSRLAIPGGGNNAIPCIAPQDVGEITAQSLLRDDLNGMRLKLTGPAAY